MFPLTILSLFSLYSFVDFAASTSAGREISLTSSLSLQQNRPQQLLNRQSGNLERNLVPRRHLRHARHAARGDKKYKAESIENGISFFSPCLSPEQRDFGKNAFFRLRLRSLSPPHLFRSTASSLARQRTAWSRLFDGDRRFLTPLLGQ